MSANQPSPGVKVSIFHARFAKIAKMFCTDLVFLMEFLADPALSVFPHVGDHQLLPKDGGP